MFTLFPSLLRSIRQTPEHYEQRLAFTSYEAHDDDLQTPRLTSSQRLEMDSTWYCGIPPCAGKSHS